MTAENNENELEVLRDIIATLQEFDELTQRRLLKTAVTYLQLSPKSIVGASQIGASKMWIEDEPVSTSGAEVPFPVEEEELAPKDFMMEKDPLTQVEKIACLAYYLTHYRGIRHFKTLHLSQLNTEAAQRKFTNAAQAVKDTTKAGMLVQATKGHKQISAIGEQYVLTLPNHEEAQRLLKRSQSRTRKPGKSSRGKTKKALKGAGNKKA